MTLDETIQIAVDRSSENSSRKILQPEDALELENGVENSCERRTHDDKRSASGIKAANAGG